MEAIQSDLPATQTTLPFSGSLSLPESILPVDKAAMPSFPSRKDTANPTEAIENNQHAR
jgi:hypothetical protein